jgi:hypothetical protein
VRLVGLLNCLKACLLKFKRGFKMFIEITISNIDNSKTTKVIKKSSIKELWQPVGVTGAPLQNAKGCSIVMAFGDVVAVTQSYAWMKKQLGI